MVPRHRLYPHAHVRVSTDHRVRWRLPRTTTCHEPVNARLGVPSSLSVFPALSLNLPPSRPSYPASLPLLLSFFLPCLRHRRWCFVLGCIHAPPSIPPSLPSMNPSPFLMLDSLSLCVSLMPHLVLHGDAASRQSSDGREGCAAVDEVRFNDGAVFDDFDAERARRRRSVRRRRVVERRSVRERRRRRGRGRRRGRQRRRWRVHFCEVDKEEDKEEDEDEVLNREEKEKEKEDLVEEQKEEELCRAALVGP